MPECLECGFTGSPDEFETAMSPYHDLRCPKCGTTHIDTSDLNREEVAAGRTYGYGDDNFLQLE